MGACCSEAKTVNKDKEVSSKGTRRSETKKKGSGKKGAAPDDTPGSNANTNNTNNQNQQNNNANQGQPGNTNNGMVQPYDSKGYNDMSKAKKSDHDEKDDVDWRTWWMETCNWVMCILDIITICEGGRRR